MGGYLYPPILAKNQHYPTTSVIVAGSAEYRNECDSLSFFFVPGTTNSDSSTSIRSISPGNDWPIRDFASTSSNVQGIDDFLAVI
jgi:hypothetical protein